MQIDRAWVSFVWRVLAIGLALAAGLLGCEPANMDGSSAAEQVGSVSQAMSEGEARVTHEHAPKKHFGHRHPQRRHKRRLAVDSLSTAGGRSHRLVGAAVAYDPLLDDAAYAELLAAEFSYLTPENELKWGSLQPNSADEWDFSRADAIVDFAKEHHQQLKGHVLVWHNQLPPFINDELSPVELRRHLKRHIRRVVRRYRHRIRSWDVVNEAVGDDGELRDTVFMRKLGPDYIKLAFKLAHRADRNALLYYNDYNIGTINTKSNRVYELVAELKEAGAPIHGVGFQMHLEAQNAPTTEAIVANFQRFAELGLLVNISELDVRVAGLSGDLSSRLAVQKQVYQRVAEACLRVDACESITTWGFSDRYSWIDATFGPDDPLPFGEQYDRKPAYYGMIDGLLQVPADSPLAEANLIANSSFEVGTDGWTAWGGVLEATRRRAHTGLRSARVSERTEDWHAAVYDVKSLVSPGGVYDASVWARIGGSESSPVRWTGRTRCEGGEEQYAPLDAEAGTSSGWTELSGMLVVPDCALEEAIVYVEGPPAGVDLFVDDAALRQKAKLGPELIGNPGFEVDAASWFGFGDAVVGVSSAVAHSGTQSGYAQNRLDTWQGPAVSLLGSAEPGSTYRVSGWVRLEGAPLSEVKMTLKSTCDTVDNFTFVGANTANDAGFSLITGSVTVPNCDATELTLYFEGPAAGVNLFLDDVSVREALADKPLNLLQNPGFESGASGWFGFGDAVVSASGLQAHSGSQSGYAENRTASWQGPAYSLLGVSGAGTYSASGWARIEGAATSQVRMTAKVTCDGVDDFIPIGGADATDGGWVFISGSFSVPDCVLSDFVVYFEGPEAGVNIYVDDVSVSLEEGSASSNLIGNPDCESGTSGWFGLGSIPLGTTSTDPHGGAQSCVAAGRNETWQGPAYDLTNSVQSDASYSVSVWVRLAGVATDQLFITAKTVCSDGTEIYNRAATSSATDSDWVEVSGSFTVPACELAEQTVYLEGPAAGVEIHYDDASVLASSEP